MGNCQPFAIMRLTHESIRSGLNEIKALIDQSQSVNIEELKSLYQDVKRVIQLHAEQEENVFYVELAKKASGVTEPFSSEHDEEKAMFKRLDELFESAITTEGKAQLIEGLSAWISDHQEHLVHEEKGLMKLLPKVFDYVESVGVVRSIIEHDIEEFQNFQLNWVYSRLKPGQKEMYLGMLEGCSPEGKFDDFQKVILSKPQNGISNG